MKGNLKRKYNYFTTIFCLDVSIFITYSLHAIDKLLNLYFSSQCLFHMAVV